jgi:hypothetical protein
MAPLVSHLYELGLIEARAYAQNACFEAAVQFARTEGFIPAPESSHAIRAAIDEALAARDLREERVIVFNLSGHGFFDMAAYDQFLAGELTDVEFEPEREEAEAVAFSPQRGPWGARAPTPAPLRSQWTHALSWRRRLVRTAPTYHQRHATRHLERSPAGRSAG